MPDDPIARQCDEHLPRVEIGVELRRESSAIANSLRSASRSPVWSSMRMISGPPGVRGRYGRATRSPLSRLRSWLIARRIARAISGAPTFAKPAGSPRLRRVIRVAPSPASSHA